MGTTNRAEEWLKNNVKLEDWTLTNECLNDALWTNNVIEYMAKFSQSETDELTKEKSLFIEKYTKSCNEVQKLEKVNDELTKEVEHKNHTIENDAIHIETLTKEVERLRNDRKLFEKRCVNLSKSTDEILEYLIPFVDNNLDDNDINRIIKWHNDNSNRH